MVPIIMGIPPQPIIMGMPFEHIFIIISQRSRIISMPLSSMGVMRIVMPSFVISMLILHIIMGIMGMGIIIGIIMGIGPIMFMPFIIGMGMPIMLFIGMFIIGIMFIIGCGMGMADIIRTSRKRFATGVSRPARPPQGSVRAARRFGPP
jgi:hypothetical protein